MKTQIFSILVDNTTGVLSRVAGLFSRRGYNITSITANTTANPKFTRITIAVPGDELILEQIENQLRKLQDVRHIKKLADRESVIRELMLVKVRVDLPHRPEIMTISDIYHGKIVDIDDYSMMISVVGLPSKLEAFLDLLKNYEILELARTGITGLDRGSEDIQYLE
ncbi:MAG: acetolactate synthase small subunit [Clostridiales bacterium]|nr:acetolactate synthase small subunit [Clostridiales bacterium]